MDIIINLIILAIVIAIVLKLAGRKGLAVIGMIIMSAATVILAWNWYRIPIDYRIDKPDGSIAKTNELIAIHLVTTFAIVFIIIWALLIVMYLFPSKKAKLN